MCHPTPHQGPGNSFHCLHQLHSEVFMTFSCLPSLLCAPFFTRANSSPLSPEPWEKKNHFYIICFLYFLFNTCGSCFAGPLLCKSPFTRQIFLPVTDRRCQEQPTRLLKPVSWQISRYLCAALDTPPALAPNLYQRVFRMIWPTGRDSG